MVTLYDNFEQMICIFFTCFLPFYLGSGSLQCDSSYGFSVIVRVTVTGFIIFQLQLQLKLTVFQLQLMFFQLQLKLHIQLV